MPRPRSVALVILLAVATFVGLVVAGVNPAVLTPTPCDDEFAAYAPQTAFAFEHAGDGTLAVSHDGGDTLDGGEPGLPLWWDDASEVCGVTERLELLVRRGGETLDRVTWAAVDGSGASALPLEDGATLVLAEPGRDAPMDARLDARLRDGDVLLVVNYGPDGSVVLGKFVVGAEDA